MVLINSLLNVIGNKNDIIQTIQINKGVKKNINAILEENIGLLIEKGKENQVTQSIQINSNIDAPIKQGDIIGQVTFSAEDTIIANVNLIADTNVEKINLFTMSKNIIYKWIDLLRNST